MNSGFCNGFDLVLQNKRLSFIPQKIIKKYNKYIICLANLQKVFLANGDFS
jgi:hypothetical protein